MKRILLSIIVAIAFFVVPLTAMSQTASFESHGQIIALEDDGFITCFTLYADNLSGEEWIKRFEKEKIGLNEEVKAIFKSKAFVPTRDTINVGIIRGDRISDPYRKDWYIRLLAANDYCFDTPTLEVAALIRYYLSDRVIKSLGFDWIITMTEPIAPKYNTVELLLVANTDDGPRIGVAKADNDLRWKSKSGFAFVWYN